MTLTYDPAGEILGDEERLYLHASLADIFFARSMLRRVRPGERRRFSEVAWPYGDPEMFGYHPYEVHEAQLCNLLYVLFGRGFTGELFSVPAMDDEGTLAEIAALDGGPVEIQDPHYFTGHGPYNGLYGGDYEEILVTEIRAYATPDGGESGEAAEGPTGRERIKMLVAALRACIGEAGSPKLHRWRDDSSRSRQLRESAYYAETDDHVLLLCGCEPVAPQELMHEYLFDRLIDAWSNRDPREAPAQNDPALAPHAAAAGHRATLAQLFENQQPH